MCDMIHSYVRHDSFSSCYYLEVIVHTCVTWLIHTCDMIHWYVWHDLQSVWHDSFICETWLIHMWDMTHSYVRHDSFICVTRLTKSCHKWVMSRTQMSHVSYTNECDTTYKVETWLLCVWDMTHLCVRHDSFVCETWLICDLQSGEDPQDALICRSFLAKQPLIMGLFFGKWPTKIRHPMGLRHLVAIFVRWLIHMCDMTHSYVRHDSFICVT